MTDTEAGLGNPCEDCGEEPSTSILIIDDDVSYLCEPCWGWRNELLDRLYLEGEQRAEILRQADG